MRCAFRNAKHRSSRRDEVFCLADPILADPVNEISFASTRGDEVADIFGTGILEAEKSPE